MTWSKVSSRARAAIDAAELVAQEQVEPGERRIFVGPHVIAKRNHRRQLERDARAVHFAVVMGDDVDPLEEHRLDRRLPRPQRQRVIRQRRIIGVEDQRRAAFGMADQLGMIHASATAFRSVEPNCSSPAPSHSRRRGRPARLPLLPAGCQPGVTWPMTAFSMIQRQEFLSVTPADDRHALCALAERPPASRATPTAPRSAMRGRGKRRQVSAADRGPRPDALQARVRRRHLSRTYAGSGLEWDEPVLVQSQRTAAYADGARRTQDARACLTPASARAPTSRSR